MAKGKKKSAKKSVRKAAPRGTIVKLAGTKYACRVARVHAFGKKMYVKHAYCAKV
jgi:hypothetical protein